MLALLPVLLAVASSLATPTMAEPRVPATQPGIGTVADGAGAPTFVFLERSLAPPVDGQGRPWRVEVVPEAGTAGEAGTAKEAEPVATATARADGTWRHAKVPGGLSVRLRVRTEDGDVWWISPEPFSTSDGERSDQIELGMIRVRGVARVGKQPLPGLVTLTGGSGLRVGLVAGVDGEFKGALPRAGSWSARVRSSKVAFDRTTAVEVEEPSARRSEKPASSFVDVHFPDRAIRGEVVDETGEPVERFTLAISEAGTTPRLEDGEGGAFRYDRIATGTTYNVYVMVLWKSSPTYQVPVPEDDDPEFVKAVVGRRRGFRGHVVSADGLPVPGGRGSLATVPSGGLDRWWLFPKGARAAFTASVTEPAKFACVFLVSPGHAAHLSMREATLDDHEIVVTPTGGTLVLQTPVEPLRIPALFRNGCALRLTALASTSGAFVTDRGRILEVVSPPVEPGPWSLCLVTRGQLESYVGGEPAFPLCVGGVLAPGSRLELSLVGVEPATSP